MPSAILGTVQPFNPTPEQLQTIATTGQAYLQALLPLLPVLGDSSRQLSKMGPSNVDFIQQGMMHATNQPAIVPVFVDITACQAKQTNVDALRVQETLLQQLLQAVRDGLMLTGAELYAAMRQVYKNAQQCAAAGMPGAQAIVDDLAARLPRRGSKTVAAPAPAPEPAVVG